MAENLKNEYIVSLNGGITAVATSIAISANGTPPVANFRVRCDDEYMLVTSTGSGADWTVTRGIEGTTATTHATGAAVVQIVTLAGLTQWLDERYAPLAGGGYQPLDADLTAIAALSTTSFGRGFLALADGPAAQSYISINTSLVIGTTLITSGAAGRVLFHSAAGNTVAEDDSFIWDSANNRLGIGGGAAAAPLAALHIVQPNALVAAKFEFFSATAPFSMVRGNGTPASPTQALSGDLLAAFAGFAYGGTGTAVINGGPGARIRFLAAEDQTNSLRGAHIVFDTVQAGGSSIVERARIVSDGGVTITPAAATVTTVTNYVLSMSHTWTNFTASPITAILLNITDTSSHAASLLMDLQVGAATKFNVNKSGGISSAALTSGRIPFAGTAGLLGDSANFLYDSSTTHLTLFDSGTGRGLLDVGTISSTAAAGISVTSANVVLNTGTGGVLGLRLGGTDRFRIYNSSGANTYEFSAGTATGVGAMFEASRTNNNAAVTTGFRLTFADTLSSAAFLPFQILGGAAGTTNLFTVSKTGDLYGTSLSIGTSAGSIACAPGSAGNFNFYNTSQNGLLGSWVGTVTNPSFRICSGGMFAWNSSATDGTVAGTMDTILSRISAGVVGVGLTAAGQVTGRLKLTSVIHAGVAVASLNASPTIGEVQAVTDALSPVAGTTVGAGGSAKALVWYNGANWTVVGV